MDYTTRRSHTVQAMCSGVIARVIIVSEGSSGESGELGPWTGAAWKDQREKGKGLGREVHAPCGQGGGCGAVKGGSPLLAVPARL